LYIFIFIIKYVFINSAYFGGSVEKVRVVIISWVFQNIDVLDSISVAMNVLHCIDHIKYEINILKSKIHFKLLLLMENSIQVKIILSTLLQINITA